MKRLRNILTILACYLRLDSLVIPLEFALMLRFRIQVVVSSCNCGTSVGLTVLTRNFKNDNSKFYFNSPRVA